VGDFYYSNVNVESSTIGNFIAPRNQSPGYQILRITNNYLKVPNIMADARILEFFKLPELHSLMPAEVPTRDSL